MSLAFRLCRWLLALGLSVNSTAKCSALLFKGNGRARYDQHDL